MSTLDRYKKKGGFVQLLNLIETSGKEKQEKFLQMIVAENPAWEAEVRKKMLTLDKVLSWNPTYLAEIFPRVQAVQLAMVAAGLKSDKEKYDKFMHVLDFKTRKYVDDTLSEKNPGAAEITTGITKLFAEIRKMVGEGALKFEKFDESMVIHENIEDMLGSGKAAVSLKELEAAVAEPPPANASPQLVEEITFLRKKLIAITQDNQKLTQENQLMKEKLEQIKKIA